MDVERSKKCFQRAQQNFEVKRWKPNCPFLATLLVRIRINFKPGRLVPKYLLERAQKGVFWTCPKLDCGAVKKSNLLFVSSYSNLLQKPSSSDKRVVAKRSGRCGGSDVEVVVRICLRLRRKTRWSGNVKL